MDLSQFNPSQPMHAMHNNVNLSACGYGSKTLRITAMMLEKAIVWPSTYFHSEQLDRMLTPFSSDACNGQSARNTSSTHGPTRRSFHQTLMISCHTTMLLTTAHKDNFAILKSLPSIANTIATNLILCHGRRLFQKFKQPVNTARLSRTLNIGNPTITRKVLEKANKAGTTSVDDLFLVLYFFFGVLKSRRSQRDQNYFDMNGSRHCRSI